MIIFLKKHISIRRAKALTTVARCYGLIISHNFKKVKVNLKIVLDFVQTLVYNIIKLKERRKPKIKKENNMTRFDEAVERMTEEDKRELISHIGWRLMEAIFYDDGTIDYRNIDSWGNHEDEIIGSISLEPEAWGSVLEEFGNRVDNRYVIPYDIDKETFDYLFDLIVEDVKNREMEEERIEEEDLFFDEIFKY